MKASRFSEEQIIGMIKEQEAGIPTADMCRKHGVSSATFYKYKVKFGGMDFSEARRLKVLEEDYNTVRPHGSLGELPPATYAKLNAPGMQ